ncbi:nucleotide exchange factor GrpE [Patescibacteria group bacterium]|nr:nucleotide exchange factor GrpE [Patescibacteria group bacterium]MBU1922027.1 nucleotide exchange factor GrpE [Patescibacteria group bacterium]
MKQEDKEKKAAKKEPKDGKAPAEDSAELQKKAEEYLAGWQRARADYENLQKQTGKEKAEMIRRANMDLVLAILPVLDNLEQAMEHKPDFSEIEPARAASVAQWFEGVENIYKQFMDILQNFSVKKIEISKKFDPNTMEAVETREDAEREDDEVLETALCGYELNSQVIRPARVIVNKKREG